MTTTFDATANRVGALALKITDRLHGARRQTGGRSESSTAALSAMHMFLDDPSIDELRRVVGLTSSATVRLVDGLVADGLATRMTAADGRVSVVRLTAAGRRTATRLVAARADVLVAALAPLTRRERATLEELVDKILIGLIRAPSTAAWMCRLCDTHACGAAPGEPCPLTIAALG